MASFGCSSIRQFCAPKGFNDSVDPHVFYESGAGENAKIISDLLHSAMQEIEKKQYGPFVKPVRLYVFSDLLNYAKHSPSKNSAGNTF